MKQNNMVAMILAGGRGSRLHDLTNKVAKPAVSYGGKYRIVDFPLSNCANSGIDVVGVLTQYESVLLNSYVSMGRRWGLDAKGSGVYVLPPREKADANLDVYRGTADAISQNMEDVACDAYKGMEKAQGRRQHFHPGIVYCDVCRFALSYLLLGYGLQSGVERLVGELLHAVVMFYLDAVPRILHDVA